MTVRVGIIGAGYIGTVHAKVLMGDKRVSISGVQDVVPAKAQEMAALTGAKVYPTIEDLLGSGVDAVYVCTPNTHHTAPVLAALKAGVHVFSEKPMATTLDEARQIRSAAASSKALYQVGHNRRFAPVYKYVKQAIAQGFYPVAAHVKMNRGELKNPPWTSNTAVTGGFLFETPVHLFDMMRWLMGDIVEVECRARQSFYNELDAFSILFAFTDNRFSTFTTVAHTTWAFPFERIELYGDHQQIATEEMERVSHSPGLGQEIILRDYFQLPLPEKWGYVEEDRLFIDSITEGTPIAVTAEDGYRAIELCEAVYRSARNNGARIHLPLTG
jgi:myo-inositol 2-dehydrogenase/D-chiro-inositol 1-dehydrogenase